MVTASECATPTEAVASNAATPAKTSASYIVFSGDLDKQLFAFTMANAAAASGLKTQMFFAFWGVSVLRKRRSNSGKGLLDRMFGWMIPCGPRALSLSRLNFLGLGKKLIGYRMRKMSMPTLEQQIATAEALGVELVACEASMQLMGFTRDEMRDSIAVGGAMQCLEATGKANVSMVV